MSKGDSFFKSLVEDFSKELGRELTNEEKEFLYWVAQSHLEDEDN